MKKILTFLIIGCLFNILVSALDKEQKDETTNDKNQIENTNTIEQKTESELERLPNTKSEGKDLLLSEDEDDTLTYAPVVSGFAQNPDLLGALSNSVNLFTGQVNLPLNLISLRGRNNLNVNVSIHIHLM